MAESIHGQVTSHDGWSDQTYRYDAIGRLTTVEDTADTVCTRRGYTFDARTNRKSLTTSTAAPGLDCTTTGATTTTHTYDSGDRIVDTGYAYDAFGRTTAAPGNGTIGYYANDLAHQQTVGGKRQTWQLDAGLRFRSWKVETGSGTTWAQEQSKLNHYDSDGDNPSWIVEDTATGALTRNVNSASGDLAATTSKAGDTVLHLTSIHGDVALQLPLTAGQAPVALDSDEYGNPRAGQAATRYNWLGAKQRSTETLTGLTLMGVRLYNPTPAASSPWTRFTEATPTPTSTARPTPSTATTLTGDSAGRSGWGERVRGWPSQACSSAPSARRPRPSSASASPPTTGDRASAVRRSSAASQHSPGALAGWPRSGTPAR